MRGTCHAENRADYTQAQTGRVTRASHYCSHNSSSDGVVDASASGRSTETDFPGTRYSSFTQRPRSIILQRSEQNGRKGLSLNSTGLPQVGHFIGSTAQADQFVTLISRPSDSGRFTRMRRLTKSIVPSRLMAFKRTVTLSRVEPTIDAISR